MTLVNTCMKNVAPNGYAESYMSTMASVKNLSKISNGNSWLANIIMIVYIVIYIYMVDFSVEQLLYYYCVLLIFVRWIINRSMVSSLSNTLSIGHGKYEHT